MDATGLLWGLLFGSVGLGYVVYGRRQRSPVAFISGLILMGLPYFIEGTAFLVVTGALLIAAPILLRG